MSIELKQAAQQALDAFEAFGEADDFATLFTLTQKMNALRTTIQQAGSQQTATAIACGIPEMAKTTCPYCEQGFAFEFKQAESEPVAWMASYVDPIGNDHVYVTSHHDLAVENDMHGTPRPLYTYPAPDDAARYALLRERFNKQKMSACQRIVEDLGLAGDPLDGLDFLVDKDRFTDAQAQKGQG